MIQQILTNNVEVSQYSDSHLKRLFFKAARINSVEILQDTIEKCESVESSYIFLAKRDPERRNVIVLCYLFASFDVLEKIGSIYSE